MHIRKVAIVGGTHGNEPTGIYLLRRWEQSKEFVRRASFETQLYLGNPKAVAMNQRFVDEDLNRSFSKPNVEAIQSASYEAMRAFFLNQIIGPKSDPGHDFIIDMHTSTSNCGVMLILIDQKPFNLRVAAYVKSQIPDARIFLVDSGDHDMPYLNSICKHSLGVEVGPVAQSVLRSDILQTTSNVVRHCLDYLHESNDGLQPTTADSLEVFRLKGFVNFSQDKGFISSVIHPQLQGRDYQPLNPGDPLFESIDGTTIYWEGNETVYPVFINEAAYYYKNIAMCLCTKETLSLVQSTTSHQNHP